MEAIVLCARTEVETFERALRAGVFGVLCQPIDGDEFQGMIADLLEARSARKHGKVLRTEAFADDDAPRIVGQSRAMRKVYRQIAECASTSIGALLVGETGTGKELVARNIHIRQAPRGPFVGVNLGNISSTLAESELFGHVKGAFTGAHRDHPGHFERAKGGTILLDEIGEASHELQVKLLRVLEEGTFRRLGGEGERTLEARVIAATNRNLPQATDEGRFRKDLLFRLTPVVIELPALRERPEDLDELVPFLTGRAARRLGLPVPVIARDAWEHLRAHAWPGNVRELRTVLERALLGARGGVIRRADLGLGVLRISVPAEPPNTAAGPGSASTRHRASEGLDPIFFAPDGQLRTMNDVDRRHLETALRHHEWKIQPTARALGISRGGLKAKIKRLGVEGGAG